MTDEEFIQFVHSGSPHWKNKGFKDIDYPTVKLTKVTLPMKDNKDCCYEEMSGGGKEGGQSITKIDNSIHSEYHNPPMVSDYENSRKGWNSNGYDQSGMQKGKK